MKIALIGYGKMGKAVEAAAKVQGHEICTIFSRIDPEIIKNDVNFHIADVCIEFSHPQSVLHNIECLAKYGKPIVVGTTGWDSQLETVRQLVENNNIGLLYSPNFSIGVQLFLRLTKAAAQLFTPFEQYDVAAYELHHNRKADAPSGTAQAIIKEILMHLPRKEEIVSGNIEGSITPHQLQISSIRVGSTPGTHTLIFDSPEDTITLTHQARNRDGFANGAITAAQWLINKKGMLTLNDLMNEMLA